MSWYVNGRRYENYNEYLRAKAAYERQQASAHAESYRQEAEQLRNRIAQREREFQQVRGDLQRQTEINQLLQADVRELGRVQNRMEANLRGMENQMNRGFQEVREQLEENDENLQRLEDAHHAHVEAVRQTFSAVRDEMQNGFQEVEERRAKTEERLRSEIKTVDDKVEADRQARLDKQQNQQSRAQEQIRMIEETLDAHQSQYQRLDLTGDEQAIRMQLAQADALLNNQNDASSALSLSTTAFAGAQTLVHQVEARQAELIAHRESVLSKIAQLREMMDSEDAQHYFKQEVAQANTLLNELENRATDRYNDYRRLVLESDKDQSVLDETEEQVRTIGCSAPVLKEMSKARVESVEGVLDALEKYYGPLTEDAYRFALEDDPKSTLIAECDFGGAQVDIHLGIDGTIELEAYGHRSNADCSQKAQAVLTELNQQMVVDNSREYRNNPQQPQIQAVPTQESWRDVGSHLTEIRRRVSS
jgi:myosin heavy subunit